MHRFERSTHDFERQHAGCVGDFLREVDLKMADNIPARLAPAAHGGHVGFLEQFSTLVDYFVDGLIMPFFKYWSRHCAASRRQHMSLLVVGVCYSDIYKYKGNCGNVKG